MLFAVLQGWTTAAASPHAAQQVVTDSLVYVPDVTEHDHMGDLPTAQAGQAMALAGLGGALQT